MSNWKNVNNWHWTEKNCINWAKDYFQQKLAQVACSYRDYDIKTTKVTEVTGDVDLNQRKGKVITIFDVAIKITWEGTAPDGTEATGTITIPEVAHDTTPDEYVFDVVVDSETAAKREIKDVVRKHLTPLLRTRLASFQGDLIDAHRKDVYIDPSQLGSPGNARSTVAPPVVSTSTKAAAAINPSVSSASSKVNNTVTIDETIEFVTSAAELYQTLLDPGRVAAWTRATPQIDPTEGAKFSLFGGNVTGVLEQLVPNQMIVQKWRLATWPADYYSQVTMTLDQGDQSVRLHLVQTGVPLGEQDQTKANWHHYYWQSIKATFG
ncbi:Co-chaperone [Dimargaris xerosporica]|nr:Co-chaperone [Dimargaris xerosporica]